MQFMRAFRDRFQFISDFPEAAQVIHSSGVRRSSLDGFPYHMYYLIDPDCLSVIAVGHHHQEPFTGCVASNQILEINPQVQGEP